MKTAALGPLVACLLTLAACGSDDDDTGSASMTIDGDGDGANAMSAPDGLRSVASVRSVAETIGEIEAAIAGNDALGLLADVDHAANAESVGETLPPTRVILFGNPTLGTPLMQASRSAGLDLPQKMLAREGADGTVTLSWNTPAWLAARHGIDPATAELETIAGALTMLAGNASGATVAAEDGAAPTIESGDGVVLVSSENDFETTYAALRASIEAAEPLRPIAELDHAANAASVGMALLPTRLIVFGNPTLGTPLLQASDTIGIDLPQKMLVWAEADGAVTIAWNAPAWVAARHGVTGRDEELGRIATALAGLAEGAAGGGPEPTTGAAAGERFREANAAREGVTVTASGLQVEVLVEGDGASPTLDDTVAIDYVGTLVDGREFDSSIARGERASFPVGGVIEGFAEGLQLMSVGSRHRFVIPPELAYGADGAGTAIGPDETLVFEVELFAIEG